MIERPDKGRSLRRRTSLIAWDDARGDIICINAVLRLLQESPLSRGALGNMVIGDGAAQIHGV
jgi:hypothetical protein